MPDSAGAWRAKNRAFLIGGRPQPNESGNHEQEETEGTECWSFLRCLCYLLFKNARRKTRNRG